MGLPGSRRRVGLWRLGALAALALVAAAIALGRLRRGDDREARWRAIGDSARAGRWGDVEAGLGRWLADFPGDGNARVMLGGLLGNRGEEARAREVLGRVATADPAWVRAQTCLGEI